MNSDKVIKSIHELDLDLIVDFYTLVKRQGPGSEAITKKALSFIEGLTEESKIADLGCGSGGQTITLGHNAPGKITGVDLFPEFVNLFNRNAKEEKLDNRVTGICGSMDKLPFKEESLDLIWSEGAIYNIGFGNGLKYWKKFLKPGGYVAVSEATWFTEERPKEIQNFWDNAYPDINTLVNKTDIMQKAGYVPVAAFNIPDSCWIENFYKPMDKAVEIYLKKHKDNLAAKDFVDNQLHERNMYMKYSQYYGYTFYIGKKL